MTRFSPIALLHAHWHRIVLGVVVALYLKFFLEPTALGFYELYHLTGIDAIYWGYSLFKAAGYFFGIWEYQSIACVLVGIVIAIRWKAVFRWMKGQTINSEAVL